MKRLKRFCKSINVLLILAMLSMFISVPVYAAEATATAAPTAAPEATVAPTATTAPAAPEVDLNGTYHAALGIQTCTMAWISRTAYFNTELNPYYGTDDYAVMNSGAESTNNFVEYTGTFTDAVIEGNGTYTVSLSSADFAGEKSISQLHVATDIPVSDAIKFTSVAAKINGRTVAKFDEAYLETDQKYNGGGIDFLIINHWRPDLVKLLGDQGLSENGNGIEILAGSGNDNIEITFTVSGFAYDKAVEATPTTAPTAAAAPADNSGSDTDAAAQTSTADDESGSGNQTIVIIVIIAVVVVAAGAAAVLIGKKKKNK